MKTKSRIRYRKQERIHRHANLRIQETFSADQRRILRLSQEGYAPAEIARELALSPIYVSHFMTGLVQRLTHDGLIPSPDWRNALLWAATEGLITK